MNLQGEVVALYYRPPSCFFCCEASCGEIDLLDYGQAAGFESGAHHAGLARKLDLSSVAQGKGNTGVPPDPSGHRDWVSIRARWWLLAENHESLMVLDHLGG
jgi:hypothetical protein